MNCLEWEHVSVRRGTTWVLRDVSLRVEHGELLCLMGTAGAGKTALLNVASGALRNNKGSVWLDGRPITRSRVSLIDHHRTLSDRHRVSKAVGLKPALHAWGLDPWREHRVGNLPDSVRARTALAALWSAKGKAWLLDDLPLHLELAWRSELPNLLKAWAQRNEACVVMATHEPDVAAKADRVAVLNRGTLAVVDKPAALCAACRPEEVVVRTVDAERVASVLYENLHLEAERIRDGLVLRVKSADAVVPGLLQFAAGQIETVWIRRPNLLDAVAHFSSPGPVGSAAQPPGKRRLGHA